MEKEKSLIKPDVQPNTQEDNAIKKESNENLINQTKSFEDLTANIEANNVSIQGSQEVFTPDMLKSVIAKIQSREWPLNAATDSNGFRAKVADLLKTDSNVNELKKILSEVENKLITESYVEGASTDHPLNKRRDERLKWKSRLEQDIQRMEEEKSLVEPEIQSEKQENNAVEKTINKGSKKSFVRRAWKVVSTKEFAKQTAKTLAGTAASVAGLRSFYDVPEYLRERFKVRGFAGKGGVKGSVEDVIESFKKQEAGEMEKGHGERRAEITDLENRFLLTKDAKKKGSEARKLIAEVIRRERGKKSMTEFKGTKDQLLLDKVLKEYEDKTEWNDERKNKLIKSALDDYTETKINGIQATREALNTAFVATGAYGLRGLSYGVLAGADRAQRVKKEIRRGEKKDEGRIKNVFIDGIKETFQDAAWKGNGSGLQKALKSVKAYGSLLRFAGITYTAFNRPEAYDQAIEKIIDSLDGKSDWGQVGRNFVKNAQRYLHLATDDKHTNNLHKIEKKPAVYSIPEDRTEIPSETEQIQLKDTELKYNFKIENLKAPEKETYHFLDTRESIDKISQAESPTPPESNQFKPKILTGAQEDHTPTAGKSGYLWEGKVDKGDSTLKLAKEAYAANAEKLGYTKELGDINKWAESASTRHIVGQYIREHQTEYSELIKKIGSEPPKDAVKLDEWLSKVPKKTFEEVLHNKVPNLVYEGDEVHIDSNGDMVAVDSEGKARLGHFEVKQDSALEEIRPEAGVKKSVVQDIPEEREIAKVVESAATHDKQLDKLAEARLNEKVGEIYKWKFGPFKGNQIEEWGIMGNQSAQDILNGKFGDFVGNQIDAAEINNRNQLSALLKEAEKSVGGPKEGQTVKDYLFDYEKKLISEERFKAASTEKEIGDIPGLVKRIEGVPKEFQDSMSKIIDAKSPLSSENKKAVLEALIKNKDQDQDSFFKNLSRYQEQVTGKKLPLSEANNIGVAFEAVKQGGVDKNNQLNSLLGRINKIKENIEGEEIAEEVPR